MKKRVIALVLTLVLGLSLMTVSAFADQLFSDVSESDWYYSDVLQAVELGLINGYPDGTFGPDEEITVAQIIKLAACMNQLATQGSVTLENAQDGVWYDTYVAYALEAGILSEPYAQEDYDRAATRLEYMNLFAKALPGDRYEAINTILDDEIPDLPSHAEGAEAVYLLYRAGIVQGDDAHYSQWKNNIKRSEVAAILTRMMYPEQRISFWIHEPEPVYDATADTEPVPSEIVGEPVDEPVDGHDDEPVESAAPLALELPESDQSPGASVVETPDEPNAAEDDNGTGADGTYYGPMGAVMVISGNSVSVSGMGYSAGGTLSGGISLGGVSASVSVGDGYAVLSYRGGGGDAVSNLIASYGSSFTFTKGG